MTTLPRPEERIKKEKVRKLKRIRKKRVLNLIEQAASQQQIAFAMGVHAREGARQYLHKEHLYEIWKKNRDQAQQKPQRKEQLKKLTATLEAIITQKSQEEWSVLKAWEYRRTRRRTTTPAWFETRAEVLHRYEQAKQQGERLTLEELAENLPISFVTVGEMFRELHIPPMYSPKQQILKETRDAIKRGTLTSLSYKDIGYFLKVSDQAVALRLKGKRKKTERVIDHCFNYKQVTYRLASQIYEALDAKFTRQETAQLLNVPEAMVTYVKRNKTTLTPRIIHDLQVLYPQQRITKPYKMW